MCVSNLKSMKDLNKEPSFLSLDIEWIEGIESVSEVREEWRGKRKIEKEGERRKEEGRKER